MITIKKIKKWSKEHPIGGGRMTNIFNNKYELSIVGGRQGLYGDFENTFEIAVFDAQDRRFITQFFFPENGDDVVGFISREDLEDFSNILFRNGDFQVR
jgi:hypothetical protein